MRTAKVVQCIALIAAALHTFRQTGKGGQSAARFIFIDKTSGMRKDTKD